MNVWVALDFTRAAFYLHESALFLHESGDSYLDGEKANDLFGYWVAEYDAEACIRILFIPVQRVAGKYSIRGIIVGVI